MPDKKTWSDLCQRPVKESADIESDVRVILNDVKNEGDRAISKFSLKFDGVQVKELKVSEEEIKTSSELITNELKSAILKAKINIEKFHKIQLREEKAVEITSGVTCWRKNVAIEKVGLYIPGGNAPLFSTVLMLGIPAVLSGCREIVLCSPPGRDEKINPAILYTAGLLGIRSIYKAGGAQAIAAMAYGTETIPRVYKIFGPGNQYVTKAKEMVQTEGLAIDMPAGPSEVFIIADNEANPEFVAADLLSQAEHGIDSQVILATNDESLLNNVRQCLSVQLKELPGHEIALQSLKNSMLILLPDIWDCLSLSNMYAPEHLIIATANAMSLAGKVTNAGSVFLGNYSCESAGDYASGTNHTLPTNGYARSYSGLSVDSFLKKITFQQITAEGIKCIGPVIETMAEAETLYGHRYAVSVRLKTLLND